MRIYFDMCSLQRPLDDKVQLRVLVEAESVLGAIALCELGQAELVSSDALRYEAGRNTHSVRRAHALGVLAKASCFVALSPEVEARARQLHGAGTKPLDALLLAFAVEAGADYFCTCDDRLIKRARAVHTGPPKVVTPIELIAEIEP